MSSQQPQVATGNGKEILDASIISGSETNEEESRGITDTAREGSHDEDLVCREVAAKRSIENYIKDDADEELGPNEAAHTAARGKDGGLAQTEKAKREPSLHDRPKAPVRFKDCVGRKFSFPFHLVQTWAVSQHELALPSSIG